VFSSDPLSLSVHQHEGSRPGGGRDSASRRRFDHRHHHGCVAGTAGGCRTGGVDQGRGGKYLVLPPHYTEAVPDGYIVLPSLTHRGYAALRSNLASGSDADVAKAVAYGKRVKVYPLSQAANPPETVFVDAIEVVYDNIIPYDLRFFEMLDRFVQAEPWLPRDIAMIDILKTLGIEKGKPFKADAKTQEALNAGAREAKAWFDARYDARVLVRLLSGNQALRILPPALRV
jgi:hypothetical protein